MTDISPTDLARYVSVKQTENLKGWSVRGHLVVLSAIFKYASRHLGFVGTNPVTLLDRVERPSIEDQKAKRILTADELARLLSAVEPEYRPPFELAAETGARLSEVLGLIWSEIDVEKQTITFTHQLGRGGKRVPLKTRGSRRVLEVTPSLISTLRKLKVASQKSAPQDFVFVSRKGTPHDHRNLAGRVLARAVKRAGLEGHGEVSTPTFHSLRHSHASRLIAAGWDIQEVSARLGHSDISTTQRIYIHEFDAAARSDDRRSRLAALYASPAEAFVEATDRDSWGQRGAGDQPQGQHLRAVGDSRG